MRKALCLLLSLTFFQACGPKQKNVERFIEDGVEVVLNNINPSTIKGKPKTFSLEEELVIDTERDKIAQIGLTDLHSFGVDSAGCIYISRERAGEDDYIFKFDEKGNYLLSFGRQGQGPGEFQNPPYLVLNELDEIMATAVSRRRLVLFNKNGTFLREIVFDVNIGRGILLKNENYLIFHQVWGRRDSDYMSQAPLSLWNSEFKEIVELTRLKLPNFFKMTKGTDRVFKWSVSGDFIYIGDDDEEYEINVYDFDGNEVRRIRKKYKEVSITKDYKEEKLKDMNPEERKVTFFPDSFPPYQTFFTSDDGWIFVMTNERGENEDESVFDIFNPEGVFVGRKNLIKYFRKYDAIATAKNNKFYCIHEKENGYKKLVVYNMRWE